MKKSHSNISDMIAMGTVLSARLPMMAMMMADPTPARQKESARMVAEKVDAAIEGAFAFHNYWMTLPLQMWQAPFGSDAISGSIDALVEPARKTMHANAKRLAKSKI